MHPAIIGTYDEPHFHAVPSGRTRITSHERQSRDAERIRAEFAASDSPFAQPTNAQPGSEEKTTVLDGRYSAELPLWHPDDRVESASRFRAFDGCLAEAACCEPEDDDADEGEEDDE
jgi:hypothetical protein